jgi:hypothetical protein
VQALEAVVTKLQRELSEGKDAVERVERAMGWLQVNGESGPSPSM